MKKLSILTLCFIVSVSCFAQEFSVFGVKLTDSLETAIRTLNEKYPKANIQKNVNKYNTQDYDTVDYLFSTNKPTYGGIPLWRIGIGYANYDNDKIRVIKIEFSQNIDDSQKNTLKEAFIKKYDFHLSYDNDLLMNEDKSISILFISDLIIFTNRTVTEKDYEYIENKGKVKSDIVENDI